MDGCPLIVLKEQAKREVYDIVAAGGGEQWRPLKTR